MIVIVKWHWYNIVWLQRVWIKFDSGLIRKAKFIPLFHTTMCHVYWGVAPCISYCPRLSICCCHLLCPIWWAVPTQDIKLKKWPVIAVWRLKEFQVSLYCSSQWMWMCSGEHIAFFHMHINKHRTVAGDKTDLHIENYRHLKSMAGE